MTSTGLIVGSAFCCGAPLGAHLFKEERMARTSHKRKSYSPERRKQILDTAAREGLTATDVKKKFGVTPVTYYSWRKKTGATVRRGRGGLRAGSG